MAQPAITDQTSRLSKVANDFGIAFWEAKGILKVLEAHNYDSEIDGLMDADGTFPSTAGTLDEVSAEDVRIVLQEALPQIEQVLAGSSSINANKTLRDAINKLRAAHR